MAQPKRLSREDILKHKALLHPYWQIHFDDQSKIERRFEVTDFTAAHMLANRIADLAETLNHHPEIRFGWGYVEVHFTTHSVGNWVTDLDIDAALKVDAALAN